MGGRRGVILLLFATLLSRHADSFAPIRAQARAQGNFTTKLLLLSAPKQKEDLPEGTKDKSRSWWWFARNRNRRIPTSASVKVLSVLDEARAMLALSDMIYAFAGIHRIARESKDTELLSKLSVPQKSGTLFPTIWENLNLLDEKDKTKLNNREVSPEFRAMMNNKEDMWQVYLREAKNEQGDQYTEAILTGHTDDDARNSGVYGIGVNHILKRFTIFFRGTVMDDGNGRATWSKNMDTELRMEENPMDDMCDETPVLHVHRGFMHALLGRRRKIINFLREYKEENPRTKDYSLYVTGHSLGGSLATLFGYFLAQEEDITANQPVTLYTFAAPPVGDADFGKVFYRLENDGKIRHARISNSNDPIPHTFALTQYAHVGVGIELDTERGGIAENYSSFNKVLGALSNIQKKISEHGLSRAFEYMGKHSSWLDEMSLEELYRERNKKGDLGPKQKHGIAPGMNTTMTERLDQGGVELAGSSYDDD